jgi:hypothetical protein
MTRDETIAELRRLGIAKIFRRDDDVLVTLPASAVGSRPPTREVIDAAVPLRGRELIEAVRLHRLAGIDLRSLPRWDTAPVQRWG